MTNQATEAEVFPWPQEFSVATHRVKCSPRIADSVWCELRVCISSKFSGNVNLFEKRPHSGSPSHTIQMVWLPSTIIWKSERPWLIKTFRLRALWKIIFRPDFASLVLWSTQRLLVFEPILLLMFTAFHFSEIWKSVNTELCKCTPLHSYTSYCPISL